MQDQIKDRSGASRTVVLIKAAPIIGRKHGETVCCAGIGLYGNWHRMYPLSFRLLEDGKKFKRWDIVEYKWKKPLDDDRLESRHVNSQSLEIVGQVKPRDRSSFLDRKIVTSLNAELAAGRSLALLKPSIKEFFAERKEASELQAQQREIDLYHSQDDLFANTPAVPRTACPYEFKFKYSTDDGDRLGTCQDWETEATFFKWRQLYGEERAISEMKEQFGCKLPERGLYFAMGTHSLHRETWLINGLVQLKRNDQPSLF